MQPKSDPYSSPAMNSVNADLLCQWPLPMPGDAADKEERGRVLIIGGSREIPGAVMLAAQAAMRAGAGKVSIATVAGAAQALAAAIPESRTLGLPETDAGGLAPSGVQSIVELACRADAIVVGPGMQDEAAACAFLLELLPQISEAKVVLDACAMELVGGRCADTRAGRQTSAPLGSAQGKRQFLGRFDAQVLLTPHAGEMAHLTGADKEEVTRASHQAALDAATNWNAIVALKGATTFIANPEGRLWRHEGGNIGLAISGSGDVLAGIIGGLAARGASLEQACVWGVALHARAGELLAERIGPLGYLAREIPEQIPMLMHALGTAARSATESPSEPTGSQQR